jgi:membrane fusion protein, multidrug efflux system
MNRPIDTPVSHRTVEAMPSEEPPPSDDLGFAVPNAAKISKLRVVALCALVTLIGAAAFLARWVPERRQRILLEAEAKQTDFARVRVRVQRPVLASSSRALVLPGTLQPLQETTLYPQTSGYIRNWNVDIGDKVKKGTLLAEIDTPELEQELRQARAQLEQMRASVVQARANNEFSRQALARYEQLTPAGLASEQDLEKQRAQAAVDSASISVATATVDAQKANIDRITKLQAFAKVTAPFDGIVTSRSIDVGALVTAGNGSPLFKVTATDPVRVFVQVPQDMAPSVRRELVATVTIREYPGRNFQGTVARTSGALDSVSRTLTAEIRIPNPNNELLTGMYAQVSLSLPFAHKVYQVPPTALRDDASGLHVAIVRDDNTLHLAPVAIERDTGASIEIASGLDGGEHVVRLMQADLTEGLAVEVEP